MAVVALAEHGNFLHAPDIYMEKIAVGGGLPEGVVDLDAPVGRKPAQPRPRQEGAMSPTSSSACWTATATRRSSPICREAGARIMLICDGDVAGVHRHQPQPDSGVDIYLGSGGAPEGVLAAAALRCVGGQMQGRLLFEDDAPDRTRARHGRHRSRTANTRIHEMASGDVMFAATGVTTGPMLRGVLRERQWRGDAFHCHAQQVRHRALCRSASQFHHQALVAGVIARRRRTRR